MAFEVGLFESFKAGCDRLIGENEDRGRIFLGKAASFKGGVETVFDIFRG